MKRTPCTQSDALLVRSRRLLADHKTRAKKAGAVITYTLADIQQLLSGSPTCGYCGMPVSFAVQLDHRVPLSRGGAHTLENLLQSCQRCNQLKGLLTEGEYRDLIVFLNLLPQVARADLERRLLAGGSRYGVARSRGGMGRSPLSNLDATDASQCDGRGICEDDHQTIEPAESDVDIPIPAIANSRQASLASQGRWRSIRR